jgi:lipoate-protein ligase A
MPVGGEILVAGQKLVGSAQVRRGDAFLQHGSILLDGTQEKVSAVGGGTTLAAVLGRSVTFEDVTAAVVANWGEPLRPPGRQAGRPSDIASVAAE